jgi:hypothetical protein
VPPLPPPRLVRNETDRLLWEATLRLLPQAFEAERAGRWERNADRPETEPAEQQVKVALGLAVQMAGELVATFLAARRPEI